MFKLIRNLIFSLIFLVIIAVLILGYLGFIPVISSFFGSDKPKDLGIKYTKKDCDSYITKAKTEIVKNKNPKSAKDSVVSYGSKEINETFTAEEISARINYAQWRYMPVNNTQVKINDDGIVEFSGQLMVDRLPGFIAFAGASNFSWADIEKGLRFIKAVKTNPPVYAKFATTIVNNQIKVVVGVLQIGRFSLPIASLNINQLVEKTANAIVHRIEGFYINSVELKKEKMIFDGTVPAKMVVDFN